MLRSPRMRSAVCWRDCGIESERENWSGMTVRVGPRISETDSMGTVRPLLIEEIVTL